MLEPHALKTQAQTDWFVHGRFGMFIHWGLYAMAARHEWVKSKERIPEDMYDLYFKHFDPDLYDPEAWADAAANAGMKYFVITTKHHEGFCLWDSKYTDYKAPNTPAGRDLLRPMVDAFSSRGLRTGFYYSLLDWHHPHYVVDYKQHPRRNALPPITTDDIDQGPVPDGSEYDGTDINAGRDQSKYAAYMRDQVRELLTEFGDVSALWFDFSFTQDTKKNARDDFRFNKGREAWESDKLLAMIRELQPNVMLTDRLDLDVPLAGGDFKTPEQAQPRGWVHVDVDGQRKPVVWEACQTFSGSWGYYRDEHTWRSARQLISTLIDCVAKGGNLLLNIGPTGRGEIDARALDRMKDIGEWMKHHSRSIYGCTQASNEFAAPEHCKLTYNAIKKRLYVHVLDWPYKLIHLDGQAYVDRIEYAQLLHDGSEVTMGLSAWHKHQLGSNADSVVLNLPQMEPPGVEVPVIELFLKD
ncbi:MAG: alpha-L-fucosidase [Planctomycetota bacterium]